MGELCTRILPCFECLSSNLSSIVFILSTEDEEVLCCRLLLVFPAALLLCPWGYSLVLFFFFSYRTFPSLLEYAFTLLVCYSNPYLSFSLQGFCDHWICTTHLVGPILNTHFSFRCSFCLKNEAFLRIWFTILAIL